jgi:hypothetical protein
MGNGAPRNRSTSVVECSAAKPAISGLLPPGAGFDPVHPHILDVRIYSYAALTTPVTALRGLGETGLGMVVHIARSAELSGKVDFLAERGETLDDCDPGLVVLRGRHAADGPNRSASRVRPVHSRGRTVAYLPGGSPRRRGTTLLATEWPVETLGGWVVMASEGDRRAPPSLRDIGD